MININNPQWNQFLTELAKQLNIGLNVVQTNARKYLLLYAKYALTDRITADILTGILFGLLVWIITFLVYSPGSEKNNVPYGKIAFACITISIFCFILFDVIKYNISPEIYAINDLINLMNRGGL